jgi:hypothetical protein
VVWTEVYINCTKCQLEFIPEARLKQTEGPADMHPEAYGCCSPCMASQFAENSQDSRNWFLKSEASGLLRLEGDEATPLTVAAA